MGPDRRRKSRHVEMTTVAVEAIQRLKAQAGM